MNFPPLQGHSDVRERFRRALSSGRLPSTFLFVGPPGVGKRAFAIHLAASLLCHRRPADQLDPCGECSDCLQVAADTHPDLEQVSKPADKNFIPIELLIGDREHRRREGLCHRLALTPARDRGKVAIIDDADYLNLEGANALLKTLEEPPIGSVLILIGTSLSKQLPTIRSRCQIVRFSPLSPDCITELLLDQGHCQDRAAAESVASNSEGSMVTALGILAVELGEFQTELLEKLAQGRFDSVALASAINDQVNAAGQDASKRRQAFRRILHEGVRFYRHLLWRLSEASVETADTRGDLPGGLGEEHWPGDAEAAADCLDCCLDTETRLESNANLATLVDCWVDDLAGIVAGREPFRTPIRP